MAEPATIERVKHAFAEAFGRAPTLLAQAPGRVNLIGEHTDYNDGFVLPMAIDRGTVVAARAGGDAIRVIAADLGEEDAIDPRGPIAPLPGTDWRNYVRGMFAMLRGEGVPLGGMELAIAGDVPQGAGLSSSASLEVAVGTAVAALAGVEIDPTRLAQLAQRAENEFAGCACGIMDQLVSARAEAHAALLIDCRSLECRSVRMPDDLRVLIVHSGVTHQHTESGYNERRRHCEEASAHLGVSALRDVDPTRIDGAAGLDPVALRRARHVVSENARTVDAADALSRGDLGRLAALMADSHRSMRDDFEITVPETDALTALLQRELGDEGGARQTGGGFGGCVIALVRAARVEALSAAVRAGYHPPDGTSLLIHACRPAGGAGLL